MEDLQKIKEFFSKPLKEERDIYDEIANEEFGMDYDQLGPNEKEWVRDEVSNMNESKKETGVDMAKKRLDQLGVKYEMSKTDKVRPFKVIYKPTGQSDEFYDTFEDIVDLFNLKGVVKSSMGEAKFMSGMLSGKDFINAKLKNYPKAKAKVNQLINMIGESKFTIEMAEWIFDFFNNAHFESPMNEAKEDKEITGLPGTVTIGGGKSGILIPTNQGDYIYYVTDNEYNAFINAEGNAQKLMATIFLKSGKAKPYKPKYNPMASLGGGKGYHIDEAKEEDKVDTITMDIPLFLRMLEYSREDASQDMDLHDVTEKAISLGKERGILQMDDYDEIIGSAEEIDKAELSEAYVPSNIKEFAKRKGISSLVNKVAGWAEKVGKGIRGGTAIGYNYSTLILDMTYQGSEIRINTDDDTVTLYDEPVRSFNDFQRVYADGEGNNLEEGMGGEIDEKYFVKVSNRDARKAIGTYEEYRDNSDIKKYDDTLYASNTPSDIYDFYYDLSSQDIEIDDWNIGEDDDYDYDSEYEKTLGENVAPNHDGKAAPYGSGYKPLEERIAKALDKINEELCPAGKAYIKRRQAAGEKSSAYLSGRGVKVCKGQMSGRKKKK